MSFVIIRFFRNYVDFRAEGMDSERILGAALKERITVLRPRKKGFTLFGRTEAKNYSRLTKIAKKYGIKIRIIGKEGICFRAQRHKDKLFICIGTVLSFMFILLMNLFVWEIDVSGNAKVPTEKILESAKSAGLSTGTLRSSHDIKSMEWNILRENDMLAWVTVNIVGCRAEICVTEVSSEAEMLPDDDKPVNLIASKSGVIRSIDVFDGFARVKVGDMVKKGDLLVSAVFEDERYRKLTLKHARAKVIAETDYSLSASFPLEEISFEKSKQVGKITEYFFFGKKICFGKDVFPKTYIREKLNGDFYFLWIKLPLSHKTTTIYSVKETNIKHSREDAEKSAEYLLSKLELEEMKGMTILSKKIRTELSDGCMNISADYMCLINIAEEQEILSDIPWENTDDMS